MVSRTSHPHARVGVSHRSATQPARSSRSSTCSCLEIADRSSEGAATSDAVTGAGARGVAEDHRHLGGRRNGGCPGDADVEVVATSSYTWSPSICPARFHRLVDGLAPGERLGCLGAPPRELRAAFTPAVAAELAEHDRDRRLPRCGPRVERQLPAHRRLRVAEVLAGVHRVHVQRASGYGFETGTVEEDTRVVVRRVRHSSLPALAHTPFFMPIDLNCHSSSVSFLAIFSTFS